ncbi:MAG: hypothetical protein IPH53_01830 [Flavobacteriales bacterium]|nr:hypothetical protein [Flavobacteriales bacterium]
MPPSLSLGIPTQVDDYTSVWSDKIKGLLTIAFSSSATSSVIDAHLSYPVSEELRYQLARIERTRALKADWDGMVPLPHHKPRCAWRSEL